MENSQPQIVSAPPPPSLFDQNAEQFNASIMGDPAAGESANSTGERECTEVLFGQEEEEQDTEGEEEQEEIVIGADVGGPPDLPVTVGSRIGMCIVRHVSCTLLGKQRFVGLHSNPK